MKPMGGRLASSLAVPVWSVVAQRPKPVMALSAALAAVRAAWVEERGVRLDMGNLLGEWDGKGRGRSARLQKELGQKVQT